MNFELKVKDVSVKTFLLVGEIKEDKILNNLINFIKENTDESLSYKTHVKGHFTGFNKLNLNEDFLNFIKLIEKNIKIICKSNFFIKDAWGNICINNEEITEHNHNGVSAFCGILYLTDGGPGTYFKEYDLTIEEKIGRYVLFHPMLLHSVKKIEKNLERITVAFNMNEISSWDSLENYKQLIKL
jgi:hypothetical protein